MTSLAAKDKGAQCLKNNPAEKGKIYYDFSNIFQKNLDHQGINWIS
jgi:hypothetical protein